VVREEPFFERKSYPVSSRPLEKKGEVGKGGGAMGMGPFMKENNAPTCEPDIWHRERGMNIGKGMLGGGVCHLSSKTTTTYY